jgi:hypothetical protein
MAKEKSNMVTNSLINKIIKASENKYGDILTDSEVVNNKDFFSTDVLGMNIAFSGELDGGMEPGVLQIVGESKSFKTLFGLVIGKSYMNKYKDSVMILFDSEFGAAKEYFDSVGIDSDRVIHLPIVTVEDLKIQINKILDKIERGEKVFLMVDSIGLLASNKELNDAIDGKEVADLTRARALTSFWRTVTAQVSLKDIPMVVINHSYDSMASFIPQKIVKGGKGGYLASSAIWMISRAQEKGKGEDGNKQLKGYKFTITIEKSRTAKEKSKLPIIVTFDGGIDKLSGILDIAVEGKFIKELPRKMYRYNDVDFHEDDSKQYVEQVIKTPEFAEYIRNTYKLCPGEAGSLLSNGVVDDAE